jgi:hypothetical protein
LCVFDVADLLGNKDEKLCAKKDIKVVIDGRREGEGRSEGKQRVGSGEARGINSIRSRREESRRQC